MHGKGKCSCCHDAIPFLDAAKYDPTGTVSIRRKFEAELTRRFARIRSLIRQSILVNDVFGLKKLSIGDSGKPQIITDAQALQPRQFAFDRPSEKIERFMAWLKEAQNEEIFNVQGGAGIGRAAWANTYIDSAYTKGIRDSFAKMRKGGASIADTWVEQSLMRPIHADRLALAYTRSYNDLSGITDEMDKQISRILAQGIGEGRGPADIAREIAERVDKIGITRARVLARTEVVSAHAEASLNTYEEAGAEGVEVEVEFTTAGDNAVCPECDALSGKMFTIAESRGMIPVHPNAVFEGSTFVSYGECEEIVRARYRGPAVVLTMGAGVNGTTIGPNHPMLTSRGFINAAEVNEGDYILYDLRNNNSRMLPDVNNQKIPLCEDSFETSLLGSPNANISASSSDLHGDIVFCYGKVEAVRPARGLLVKRDIGTLKDISESLLMGANPYSVGVSGIRPSHFGGHAIALASSSLVGGPDIGVLADYSGFAWVKVLHKEMSHFDGWAFDYSTASSLYCNNGFVVKNCRCSFSPIVVGGTGIELV